jgi:hypothetical protein
MNVLICIGNALAIVKICRESYNLWVSIHDKIKKLNIIDT